MSLILVPDVGNLFLLLGCLVQSKYEIFCLVLLYFPLSCFVAVS